jgi:hypothetical protein
MTDFWHVPVNPAMAQRTQDGYNTLQAQLARERAASDQQRKEDAARREVQSALAAGLADMLRRYPDVFADTKLSPATVAEWAARFAAQI